MGPSFVVGLSKGRGETISPDPSALALAPSVGAAGGIISNRGVGTYFVSCGSQVHRSPPPRRPSNFPSTSRTSADCGTTMFWLENWMACAAGSEEHTSELQ